VTAGVGLVAVLSARLTERTKIPSPALFLVGAALAVNLVPSFRVPSATTVQHAVTVALVLILFDGGMHLGRTRFSSAAGPIVIVGVIGTFGTVAAGAALVHLAFGLNWYLAVLLATAVAPTDPAVVFSVLGRREIAGRSDVILEGESGTNDPVGISLMAGLIAAHGLGAGPFGQVGVEFAIQMGVGGAVGVLGGRALAWFMRRVALPSEGLYPLRTLAAAVGLFAVATLAHGSGFLAVFVAGIMLGDERAPYKRETMRFHAALASLGEIVAFVVLGLTVRITELGRLDVWLPGLILGLALALVIRPLVVGLCLIPARLRSNERNFVLFAGLKGAVPILLGSTLLAAQVADAQRLYGIVVVVVIFSIVAQGSLVPAVARLLRLRMTTVELEPWALGIRLRHEPNGAYRLRVEAGSPADGCRIEALDELPGDAWISFVLRGDDLVPVRGNTELRAGDDLVVMADPGRREALALAFERRAGPGSPG
jgi:cell volume regulation protein A